MVDKTAPFSVRRSPVPAKAANVDQGLLGPRQITVGFDYCLEFTQNVFQPDNPTLFETIRRKEPERRHQLVCFVDEVVLQRHPRLPQQLEDYADTHRNSLNLLAPTGTVPAGEAGKTPAQVQDIQRSMLAAGIDRHSVVIAVGGGAVLDTVGYAAATFHRGIRLVRLPTTVLGQNDAGVGVKNGVNFHGIKNLLGCFAPPFAVINDRDFIRSLSLRDRRAGIAEAVKVAAIRDRKFFHWMEANAEQLLDGESDAIYHLIQRCAAFHGLLGGTGAVHSQPHRTVQRVG